MAFYVPLGPRGLIFRVGSVLTGALGSFIYWQAARRRPLRAPSLTVAPVLADIPPAL